MSFKDFYIKYKKYFSVFFTMVFLLILIEVLGGVNGVLGFIGFSIAIALFRLWTMREAYLGAVRYGATLIEVAQQPKESEKVINLKKGKNGVEGGKNKMKKVLISLMMILVLISTVSATCMDKCYSDFCREEYKECKETTPEGRCFRSYCDSGAIYQCKESCEKDYLRDENKVTINNETTIVNEGDSYHSSGMNKAKFGKYLNMFKSWFKNLFVTKEEQTIRDQLLCENKADLKMFKANTKDSTVKGLLMAKCLADLNGVNHYFKGYTCIPNKICVNNGN